MSLAPNSALDGLIPGLIAGLSTVRVLAATLALGIFSYIYLDRSRQKKVRTKPELDTFVPGSRLTADSPFCPARSSNRKAA